MTLKEGLIVSRKKHRLSFCLFPGYKWCGPGCSGPGEPINDVDACCKAHDDCLEGGGSFCTCDRELLKCLRSKLNFHSKKGIIALIMFIYFNIQIVFTCFLFNRSK
ncbi:phospholipase [Cytobacillus oceanisediminis]|uniref:phospholipase n=1 Tax=Cytobacillus oceanisediminis TaxID=665099 RepID=UPI0037359AF3